MTIGTILFTWARGKLVGTDKQGNRYYSERHPRAGYRQRRWVIYRGTAEGSRVPPEWHAWLHYTIDQPLEAAPGKPWLADHRPNPTGTGQAYLPAGHDLRGGQRPRATGDYEAWRP